MSVNATSTTPTVVAIRAASSGGTSRDPVRMCSPVTPIAMSAELEEPALPAQEAERPGREQCHERGLHEAPLRDDDPSGPRAIDEEHHPVCDEGVDERGEKNDDHGGQ